MTLLFESCPSMNPLSKAAPPNCYEADFIWRGKTGGMHTYTHPVAEPGHSRDGVSKSQGMFVSSQGGTLTDDFYMR